MCTTHGVDCTVPAAKVDVSTQVAGTHGGGPTAPTASDSDATGGLDDALAGLAAVTENLSVIVAQISGIAADDDTNDSSDVAGAGPVTRDPATGVAGAGGSGAVDQTAEGGGATDAVLGASEAMPDLKEALTSLIDVLNKLIAALTALVDTDSGGAQPGPPTGPPTSPEPSGDDGIPPAPQVPPVGGGGDTGSGQQLRDDLSTQMRPAIVALEADTYPSESAAEAARDAFLSEFAAEIDALGIDTTDSFTILQKIPPAVEGTEEGEMVASSEAWYQPGTADGSDSTSEPEPTPVDGQEPEQPDTETSAPGYRSDIPADLVEAFKALTETTYASQIDAVAARDAFLAAHNIRVLGFGLASEFSVLPSLTTPGAWQLTVSNNNWMAA